MNEVKHTDKVVHIDSARPHIHAKVKCKGCQHEWIAVYPERTRYLECPECGTTVNEWGTLVSTHECAVCNRAFTLCPAVNDGGWQTCLSEDCGSYDPSRDVDKFFGSVKRDDDE